MKKAGLSFVMMLVLVIFAAFVIMFVSIRMFKILEVETQTKVCEIDIATSNKLLNNKDSPWALERVSAARVKHPYCKSIVTELDFTKYKFESDSFNEQVTVELGEMIENCWDTFGEGKYPNTFGQDYGWDDRTNYYFPCYKFKFKLDEPTNTIKVKDLVGLDEEIGSLWTYNTNGQKIKGDYLEITEKYLEGNQNYESYLGFVFFGGNGYVEFVQDVDTKLGTDFSEAGKEGAIAALAGGTTLGAVTATGTIVGLKMGMTLGGIGGPLGIALGAGIGAGIGAVSAGTVYFVSGLFYDKMVPGSGVPITDLYPEQWYEVRYYSPYIEDMEEYGNDFVLNNIKIVPLGVEAGGVEVKGII